MDKQQDNKTDTENKATNIKCPNCNTQLKFIGNTPIRVGGTGGGGIFFFGKIAQIHENIWYIKFYQCEKCGHLEMIDNKQYPAVPEDTEANPNK